MATLTTTSVATSRPPDLPSDHDVAELRLALVCYGGVSLAIYMHGITKELEKLARASVKLIESPTRSPFPPDRSELAYFNALKRKADTTAIRTRVVSTSSRAPRQAASTACASRRRSRSTRRRTACATSADEGRDPEAALALAVAAAARRQPDAEVARWRVQRDGRQRQGHADAAGPDAQPLRHDDGHPRLQPAAADRRSARDQHCRQQARLRVLRPRRRRQPRQRAQPGARVRRARATSCFPGAFPATGLADIQQQEARERFPTEFCRAYELAGSPVDQTFFIDGGVLDNFPFRHAIRAIPGKPAATQVDRRLLFIEPDPGDPQDWDRTARRRGSGPPSGRVCRSFRAVSRSVTRSTS